MSYRDNVEQAAIALKRGEDANWELARLTYENTYQAGDGRMRRPEGRVPMDQWCSDVRNTSGRRFSKRTGDRYREIWISSGLPAAGKPDGLPAWADAYAEARGETIEEMRARVAPSEITESTPETKREVFQQLARDPDVIEEAAAIGSPTSRAVSDLYTRTERVREEFRERETEADPIAKRLDEVGAALDLEAACNRFARDLVTMSERFAREINAALPRTGPARDQHLYWVRQALERARSVLNELESYAETGRTDLDAFLSDVLGGR